MSAPTLSEQMANELRFFCSSGIGLGEETREVMRQGALEIDILRTAIEHAIKQLSEVRQGVVLHTKDTPHVWVNIADGPLWTLDELSTELRKLLER